MKHLKDYECIIGIDTSNYTTSIAAVAFDGRIIFDERKTLVVKEGERGLRQSEALFQHMKNFPFLHQNMYEYFEKEENQKIKPVAVCVSSKPRPVDDSYMPVFLAGIQFANVIATSLNIPLYETSHQEGHIQAGINDVRLNQKEFITFHLSGGTSEILKVCKKDEQSRFDIEIIGGTKDISFGQLVDRLGVAMGMPFPAGEKMNNLAIKFSLHNSISKNPLKGYDPIKPINIDDTWINLSGIETHFQRLIYEKSPVSDIDIKTISYLIFDSIANALIKLIENAISQTSIKDFLFVGGVSASEFVRDKISKHFTQNDININFCEKSLSSDNAVGIALIGIQKYIIEKNMNLKKKD